MKRALVVAPRAPDFDRGSAAQRTLNFMEFLQDSGWDVTFAAAGWCRKTRPRHVRLEERYANILNQRGIPTYAGLNAQTQDLILTRKFDVAVLTYFHVAEAWMPALRKLSPSTRIVVDSLDLHLLRSSRQRFQQGQRFLIEEHAGEADYLDDEYAWETMRELNVYASADMVLAVSDKEAALISDFVGEPELTRTVPDGDELEASSVPFEDRNGVIFVGDFSHPPNQDAVTYLSKAILPHLDAHVRNRHPVYVVGSAFHKVDQRLTSADGVRKVGWVPTVVPYLERAKVAVMPLLYGAGTKRKLIQALMVGTPSVATPVAIEGMDVRNHQHLLVANDPAAFAGCITRLLQDSDLWQQLSRQGRDFIRSTRSREIARQAFLASISEVLSRPSRPGDRAARLELFSPKFDHSPPGLRKQLQDAIGSQLPLGSSLLIVSRGDAELLNLDGFETCSFPKFGHDPANSEEAILHLEKLRDGGAQFFVLPKTSFWWLRYYGGLQRHLERSYRVVFREYDVCTMYSLSEPPSEARRPILNSRRLEELALVPGLAPPSQRSPATPQPTFEPALRRVVRDCPPASILVVGVYLADRTNNMPAIVSGLAQSSHCTITQQWVALGRSTRPREVAPFTKCALETVKPKFEVLNELLHEADVNAFDYVMIMDDDILLPAGFADYFFALQADLKFALAQPALTNSSRVRAPMVRQQWGVVARQTLLVEPGPVVSFHRSVYDLLLPFDLTSPMGLGYENVWSHVLRENNIKMGIIDAVPVYHGVRDRLASANEPDKNLDRSTFLRGHKHLPTAACMTVVNVHRADSLRMDS